MNNEVQTLTKTEVIGRALYKLEREETADHMAELLMDTENSSYKMFEELALHYLNANPKTQEGIDIACSILTGWNLDTIANQMLKENIVPEYAVEKYEKDRFITTDITCESFEDAVNYIKEHPLSDKERHLIRYYSYDDYGKTTSTVLFDGSKCIDSYTHVIRWEDGYPTTFYQSKEEAKKAIDEVFDEQGIKGTIQTIEEYRK